MKRNLIYSIILIVVIGFAAASIYAQEPESDKPTTEQEVVKYTCSMHPEVIQDEPGKCPKCGMELVEKKCVHKKMDHKHKMQMDHKHKMHDTTGCMKKHHMVKDTTKTKKCPKIEQE